MEGQAEVATVDKETGKPLNGTLKYQLTDPRTAAEFAPLWDKAKSNWTVLPEIKVEGPSAAAAVAVSGFAGEARGTGSSVGEAGVGAEPKLICPGFAPGAGVAG